MKIKPQGKRPSRCNEVSEKLSKSVWRVESLENAVGDTQVFVVDAVFTLPKINELERHGKKLFHFNPYSSLKGKTIVDLILTFV